MMKRFTFALGLFLAVPAAWALDDGGGGSVSIRNTPHVMVDTAPTTPVTIATAPTPPNNSDGSVSTARTTTGVVSVATNGAATVAVSASGSGTGLAYSFQCQAPDATFSAINAYPVPATGQNGAVTSSTAQAGEWIIPGVAGCATVQVNLTAITGGTETFGLRASQAPAFPATDAAIASGVPKALIQCDQHVFKHITTATDTLAVQGVANQTIYICGFYSRAAGTATWFLENTASANANCVSALTQIDVLHSEVANSGISSRSPFWSGLKNTSGQGLCINSTGTGGVDVAIDYTQQP